MFVEKFEAFVDLALRNRYSRTFRLSFRKVLWERFSEMDGRSKSGRVEQGLNVFQTGYFGSMLHQVTDLGIIWQHRRYFSVALFFCSDIFLMLWEKRRFLWDKDWWYNCCYKFSYHVFIHSRILRVLTQSYCRILQRIC